MGSIKKPADTRTHTTEDYLDDWALISLLEARDRLLSTPRLTKYASVIESILIACANESDTQVGRLSAVGCEDRA